MSNPLVQVPPEFRAQAVFEQFRSLPNREEGVVITQAAQQEWFPGARPCISSLGEKHVSNPRCGGRKESRMGPWGKGRSRRETWAEPIDRKHSRQADIMPGRITTSPGISSWIPLPWFHNPLAELMSLWHHHRLCTLGGGTYVIGMFMHPIFGQFLTESKSSINTHENELKEEN